MTGYSNEAGKPLDSLESFLPLVISRDTLSIHKPFDDAWGLAGVLYAGGEPVLWNYYLGHPRYRCVWFPGTFSESRNHPVVLTLHKEGEHVWLTSKIFSSLPIFEIIKFGKSFYPTIIDTILSPFDTSHNYIQTELRREVAVSIGPDTLSVSRNGSKHKYSRTRIDAEQNTELTVAEWATFEAKLAKSDFWETDQPTHPMQVQLDPPGGWFIEAHLNDRYWAVERFHKKNFNEAAGYLMALCGLPFDAK